MTIAYFQMLEPEGFAIVDKTYFDTNGHLDGDGLSEAADAQLPLGFYALAECFYEHTFDTDEEAKQSLINVGFEEKQIT
jgi:hypothetical protein